MTWNWDRIFGKAAKDLADIGATTGQAAERLAIGHAVKEKIDHWIAESKRLRESEPLEAFKLAARAEAGIDVLKILTTRGEDAQRS